MDQIKNEIIDKYFQLKIIDWENNLEIGGEDDGIIQSCRIILIQMNNSASHDIYMFLALE